MIGLKRLGGGSILGLGLAFALLAPAAASCGGGGDSQSGSGFGGGKGTSTDHGGTGSGAGSGMSSFVGSGGTSSGISTNSGMSGSGGGINPDAACATSSADATLIPVDMFIMFDDSGSMNMDGKWTAASAALNSFFADPKSAGLSVALRFFPAGTCSQQGCDVPACATPLVPLGKLTAASAPTDTQEAALINAVNGTSPTNGGGTPLSAALNGAEDWATAYQAAHVGEKVVVVLVTDGQPNGCDEDITDISAFASAALASNGILTFAVGLEGSATTEMNSFAMAGGTQQAFFIGTGTNAEQELVAALQSIQGKAVSCKFTLPTTDKNGDPIDPAKVNVDYTPGMGSEMEIGQVTNAAACGTGAGWYYDNNQNPTTITLCPNTCAQVQADQDAKIQILFGCATKMIN